MYAYSLYTKKKSEITFDFTIYFYHKIAIVQIKYPNVLSLHLIKCRSKGHIKFTYNTLKQ